MGRTVLSGGRVFDGTGSAIADADVVIGGEQIIDVGIRVGGDEAGYYTHLRAHGT